jgi:DNA-binding transcriptional ArsR family regulator
LINSINGIKIVFRNKGYSMETRFDLLLNPVRIRILMAVAGRQMTPHQIASAIPDVPLTTLYRHINLLVDGNILEIKAEKQVRGTVERAYGLIEGSGLINSEELGIVSHEDHMRYFVIFLSSLLQDFAKFVSLLEATKTPLSEVLFSKVALYLTESDRQSLISQVQSLLAPYTKELPKEDSTEQRQRFIFGSVAIPDLSIDGDLVRPSPRDTES